MLRRRGWLFGGENSGHILQPDKYDGQAASFRHCRFFLHCVWEGGSGRVAGSAGTITALELMCLWSKVHVARPSGDCRRIEDEVEVSRWRARGGCSCALEPSPALRVMVEGRDAEGSVGG